MNGTAAPIPSAYPSHALAHHGYTAVQQHSPQATAAAALSEGETSVNGSSKKRKASGAPGSRGVANLTPDQLAKKRANDREAQRAIRERTRNTIANLEQRIRELESQQPFQELQRAITERDTAQRECEELRHRLATVAHVVGKVEAANNNGGQQQQLAPSSLNGTFTIDDYIDPTWLNADGAELAALTAQQAPLPPHPSQLQHAGSQGPFYDQHVHPDLRSPSCPVAHESPSSAHTEGGAARRWSPVEQHQYPQQNGGQYEQQLPPPAPVQAPKVDGENARLGINFIMDQSSPNQHPAAPPHDHLSEALQMVNSTPLYARLPNNTPPVAPLDNLLSDFIATRRQQLKAGASMQEILGPEYPSFIALHDLNSPARKNCHPTSALLIDILSKFPDIETLPEKVAVLYIMFLVMRWSICPCEACYERLPTWARPVDAQIDLPHATWIDNLPWPFMRRQLASASTPVNFDEFFVPYTTTLSLNWPYSTSQVLISSLTEDGSGVKLNPLFEMHLRVLDHWSLGVDFQRAFPDLVNEEVRIHPVKP
ncbi:hypothetical protein LTR53_015361 [Teratosphaeriaceae sp. CCFEE 6253]|nr:hypothetical protein LTR53_015361 [Teratosphaeriaceae sp. CCFEE 6253]